MWANGDNFDLNDFGYSGGWDAINMADWYAGSCGGCGRLLTYWEALEWMTDDPSTDIIEPNVLYSLRQANDEFFVAAYSGSENSMYCVDCVNGRFSFCDWMEYKALRPVVEIRKSVI